MDVWHRRWITALPYHKLTLNVTFSKDAVYMRDRGADNWERFKSTPTHAGLRMWGGLYLTKPTIAVSPSQLVKEWSSLRARSPITLVDLSFHHTSASVARNYHAQRHSNLACVFRTLEGDHQSRAVLRWADKYVRPFLCSLQGNMLTTPVPPSIPPPSKTSKIYREWAGWWWDYWWTTDVRDGAVVCIDSFTLLAMNQLWDNGTLRTPEVI